MDAHAPPSKSSLMRRADRQAVARSQTGERDRHRTPDAGPAPDCGRLRPITADYGDSRERASGTDYLLMLRSCPALSNVDGPRVESPASPASPPERRFSSTRLIPRGKRLRTERRLRREG